MRHLLSYGGGVNSTAVAIFLRNNMPELFEECSVVFADTRGEEDETYEFINKVFTPWLYGTQPGHIGKELVTVAKEIGLEEYCLRDQVLPMRRWKWCTDKWKIRVINEWADKALGLPRTHIIAFAADEAHRAQESPIDGVTNWFPLIEYGITRQGCIDIISEELSVVPPKSGCFFCPLASRKYFRWLKKERPALFARAVAMEENVKDKGYTLNGKPLKYLKIQEELFNAKEHDEDECSSGYCFT